VTFSEVTRWSRQRLLTRAVAPLIVFYTGPDRRFVQEMPDQSWDLLRSAEIYN
jgi:hypothetical protein